MAIIRPFVGTRYNARHVGELSNVLTPPYDVISPKMREELHARHPNNFVHLDLGRDMPGDDSYSNRYSRAAGMYTWGRGGGVMLDDARPSLYIYTQTFRLPDGQEVTRSGFFAAVRLEALGAGGIMAHERTFEGPKADRLSLMQATRANFSAVFALYSDPEKRVDEILARRMTTEKAWDCATDADGIRHRLWVVNQPDVIETMRALLADRPLYIADGHHRYETALRYAEEMHHLGRGPLNGTAPHDHVLMYLVNTENPGLVILPTHRVLHRDLATDVGEVKEDLSEFFDLVPSGLNWDRDSDAARKIEAALAEAGQGGRTAFAMLLPGGEATILRLKPDADLDAMIDDAMPREKKSLDATILHFHVINRCWIGNPEYDIDEEECRYVRDIEEAMDLLRSKKFCVALLMNPTSIEQVKAIAAIGERMPQKSTYFYPKVISGLVTRDLTLPLG
jgi:uncharacterized protein (DUF1015 family)